MSTHEYSEYDVNRDGSVDTSDVSLGPGGYEEIDAHGDAYGNAEAYGEEHLANGDDIYAVGTVNAVGEYEVDAYDVHADGSVSTYTESGSDIDSHY